MLAMAILRSTDPKSALYCVQYSAMMLVLAQLTFEETGTICTQQQASATSRQRKLHHAARHSQALGSMKHRHIQS